MVSFYVESKEPEAKIVTTEEITKVTREILRKNAPILIEAWRLQIQSGQNQPKPGQRLTKNGQRQRRPYAETLIPKLWMWPSMRGVTLVVGPEARSAPHAHLAEKGTKDRTRKPYQFGARGQGHGVRGKYEFVNFRFSRKHGKPPFKEGNAILRTGSAPARRWKESAASSASEKFLEAVTNDLLSYYARLVTGK